MSIIQKSSYNGGVGLKRRDVFAAIEEEGLMERFESKVQISKLLNDLKRDGMIKVNFSTKAPRSFVAVAVEQEE